MKDHLLRVVIGTIVFFTIVAGMSILVKVIDTIKHTTH